MIFVLPSSKTNVVNESNCLSQCTMWKLRKFAFTLFWQIFRETNVFSEAITK